MSRHKARQQALELLYSREFHGENDIQYSEQEILENDYVTTDALTEDGPELSDQEQSDYTAYLVDTTTAHRDELDTIIRSFAKGWDIERMNRTDRNILRLSLCELVYPKETLAPSIVLNEAVILAKEFSGDKSARFVNGILGAYVRSKA
ncbi:transcription antitermination factor NusB [uncultured Megasphaera sp.]|uniref:transcription antitermination factor NusB n=1 Tax=Megasphaera sp. TaxID=2023260 RepID=UPI0026009B26|nr:transcription antitermination factor NusB [uncultured Megasphaera sp.]